MYQVPYPGDKATENIYEFLIHYQIYLRSGFPHFRFSPPNFTKNIKLISSGLYYRAKTHVHRFKFQ